MRIRGKPSLLWAAWGVALATGFAFVARYDNTPSAGASAPTEWPRSTPIPVAAAGRSTLLVFAHPKCPCTDSTLKHLAVAMEHHRGTVEARVLFVRPPGVEARWERTDLWEQASRIEGVTALVDDEAREATRFGVRTSGQVLLFAPDGRLLFSGGITASRGHEGGNAFLDALEVELGARSGPLVRTPVFGCSLLADTCPEGTAPCLR